MASAAVAMAGAVATGGAAAQGRLQDRPEGLAAAAATAVWAARK